MKTLRGGAVVARQAHNLKAVGSIPAPATKKITPGSVNGSGFFIFNKSLMPFTLPPPYVSDASISVDCRHFVPALRLRLVYPPLPMNFSQSLDWLFLCRKSAYNKGICKRTEIL